MSAPTAWGAGILDSVSSPLFAVDRQRRITVWNKATEALTGFAAEEVLGRECRDRIVNHVDAAGDRLCGRRCPLLLTLQGARTETCAAHLHHRDGHRVPVELTSAALRGADGRIMGAVAIYRDRSPTQPRCKGLSPDPVPPCTLLYADIDRFKQVNREYGHDAGERIVCLVARTLEACAGEGSRLLPWDGEKLTVVAPVMTGSEAVALGERLRRLVAGSWLHLDGRDVSVTVTVGVAVSRADESLGQLSARAADALSEAKSLRA